MAPFLTDTELAALDVLLFDARLEARRARRSGQGEFANALDDTIATVQGVLDRHRALTLQKTHPTLRGTPQ